jgi:hypothetical protein
VLHLYLHGHLLVYHFIIPSGASHTSKWPVCHHDQTPKPPDAHLHQTSETAIRDTRLHGHPQVQTTLEIETEIESGLGETQTGKDIGAWTGSESGNGKGSEIENAIVVVGTHLGGGTSTLPRPLTLTTPLVTTETETESAIDASVIHGIPPERAKDRARGHGIPVIGDLIHTMTETGGMIPDLGGKGTESVTMTDPAMIATATLIVEGIPPEGHHDIAEVRHPLLGFASTGSSLRLKQNTTTTMTTLVGGLPVRLWVVVRRHRHIVRVPAAGHAMDRLLKWIASHPCDLAEIEVRDDGHHSLQFQPLTKSKKSGLRAPLP